MSKGGLADALLSSRIAEAGFNEKCMVLRADGIDYQCYIIPLDAASAAESQLYVIPLSEVPASEGREAARRKIIGPLSKLEFQTTVRRLNNGVLVPFNPKLTSI